MELNAQTERGCRLRVIVSGHSTEFEADAISTLAKIPRIEWNHIMPGKC